MITFIWPPQSVSVSVPPLEFELDGVETTVSRDTAITTNSRPLPVINLDETGAVANPLTDTELRASPVPVSGPLTDAELRATAVPISGTVTANTGLTQPLTDTELRAAPVPVSGPLTDAELRATAVPVSGTVTANTGLSQPLTDTELRATSVPVSVSGVATESKQDSQISELQDIEADIEGMSAKLPAALGQTNNAGSISATLSTEMQTILEAIRDGIRSSVPNGASQSNSTVGTTADNVSIPASTVGFIIQGYAGNVGLYWALNGTAVNDGSSGHLLEDSRDSGFIPYSGTGNLSVIGAAASTRYQITWFTRT